MYRLLTTILFLFIFYNAGWGQNPDSIFYSARAKYKVRKLDEALKAVNKALEIDTSHYEALLLKGMILYDQKKYDEGIVWAGKSIHSYDRNPEAYYERGLMLYYHGKVEESAEDFTQACNIAIRNADYFYYKGISLLETGETYEGCKAIKRAGKIGIDEDIESLEEKYDCANVEKPESSNFFNKLKERFSSDEEE